MNCFLIYPKLVRRDVLDACRQAATAAEFKVVDWEASDIYANNREVWAGVRSTIVSSMRVIAILHDEHGKLNANVLYELGFAHGRHGTARVVTLADASSIAELPFDLQRLRHEVYWPVDDGRNNDLKQRVRNSAKSQPNEKIAHLAKQVRAFLGSRDDLSGTSWHAELAKMTETQEVERDEVEKHLNRLESSLLRARQLVRWNYNGAVSGCVGVVASLAGFSIFGLIPVTNVPVIVAAALAAVAGAVRLRRFWSLAYLCVAVLTVLASVGFREWPDRVPAFMNGHESSVASLGLAMIAGVCMILLRPPRKLSLISDAFGAAINLVIAVAAGAAMNSAIRPSLKLSDSAASRAVATPWQWSLDSIPGHYRGYVAVLVGCIVGLVFYRTPIPVHDIARRIRKLFRRTGT